MILKSLKKKFFILMAIVATANLASGAEDPSGSQSCKDELRNAKTELENMVNGASQNNQTQTSSTSQNGQPQQQQDPMSQMMQQMQQSQQQRDQAIQQAMEQARQLDNERFKQLNELNDKCHEFGKGDFKRRMAITDAKTALSKQQSEVHQACIAKAEEDYNKEFLRLDELSRQSTYQVSDMSRMSGTNKRMQASLAVYRRRCESNPATRMKLQDCQNEYDAKMNNFKIAAEEIASDVSYTQSKIGLLEAHMADQKRQLAEATQTKLAALQQQQQMQMMQMAFGMMTASAGQQQQAQNDQEFRSADEALNKWDEIYQKCRNATSDNVKVPSDVYRVFVEVNDACRGSGSSLRCVENSNRESDKRTPSNTTTY